MGTTFKPVSSDSSLITCILSLLAVLRGGVLGSATNVAVWRVIEIK